MSNDGNDLDVTVRFSDNMGAELYYDLKSAEFNITGPLKLVRKYDVGEIRTELWNVTTSVIIFFILRAFLYYLFCHNSVLHKYKCNLS